MKNISTKEFRKNTDKYLSTIISNTSQLFLSSGNKKAILISEKEFIGLTETSYLLSTAANRNSLKIAIEQIENKQTISYK
jgi:PHD/YefM family antitoxin component YafN of YafNO toxin-antitoxin module